MACQAINISPLDGVELKEEFKAKFCPNFDDVLVFFVEFKTAPLCVIDVALGKLYFLPVSAQTGEMSYFGSPDKYKYRNFKIH